MAVSSVLEGLARSSRLCPRTFAGKLVDWDVVNEPYSEHDIMDVLGDDEITGVRLNDTQTGAESDLPIKGLFIAIEHTPVTRFLDGQLELDAKGYVQLKDPHRSTTSVEGVFAAGDVADSTYRQAVTAAGSGCQGALDAEWYLRDTEF